MYTLVARSPEAMKTLVLALAGLQLASALSVQPAAVPRTLVASGVEHTKAARLRVSRGPGGGY